MTPEERYLRDPVFHRLVRILAEAAATIPLDALSLRDATGLAIRLNAERLARGGPSAVPASFGWTPVDVAAFLEQQDLLAREEATRRTIELEALGRFRNPAFTRPPSADQPPASAPPGEHRIGAGEPEGLDDAVRVRTLDALRAGVRLETFRFTLDDGRTLQLTLGPGAWELVTRHMLETLLEGER